MLGIMITVLSVLLVVICLALIGLILVQRGKGGGLVALGGSGVEQAFGTHAATLAQKATAVLAILFLVVTIVLAKMYRPESAVKKEPGTTATESEDVTGEKPAAKPTDSSKATPAPATDAEKE